MSRSQKPRRKYDPNRFVRRLAAGVERRIDARELTDSQQRDLGLCYHMAFETMLKNGDEESWYVLAGSLNVALVLAEQGYGEEFIGDIKHAMESLMDAKYRADRTGRWAFDGDGINHMRIALGIHDQQCALAKRSEIKKALQMITERANAGYMYSNEECVLEAA
ncbi:hypothetical protein [Paraburkholderia tropica]|uniref:hypothetical protein n=1 Tax=Paraburkholderia tropica TaxID=92647 RepID=UPI002AB75857|nr:hypothetical protein [Paraburkholderia tropica]